MKVFVAGASGTVGGQLVPMLVANGHTVVGTTKTPGKADAIRAAGAEPVLLDILDRDAVVEALTRAEPDVVVHQATALAGFNDFRKFEEGFAATNRLRTEGTANLLEGMRRLGIRRLVAQSYAGPGAFPRTGGFVKSEDDGFDPNPPAAMRTTVESMAELQRAVLDADWIEGTVLRYGGFYGPGTGLAQGGVQLEGVRRRRFPIVAGGTGVWSLIHIEDVATATLRSIENPKPGVYNIVDDEPAPVAEWLPFLARAIGAKPPRHMPAWVGRIFAGELGVIMMTESRGASNEKAKRELGWTPTYPSWRIGFTQGLGRAAAQNAA